MKGNFLLIDKRVLPDVFEKVVECKRILKNGEVKEITEATKKVGISRSVYYKYRDYVHEFSEKEEGNELNLNITVKHKKGVLGIILNYISNAEGNILTIDQSSPNGLLANVNVSIDISNLNMPADVFIDKLSHINEVEKVELISIV